MDGMFIALRPNHESAADSSQSVLTLKYDDDFRRLGFVGRQTGHMRITPVGKGHHHPRRRIRVGALVRLYDIQSVAVEEERPNNSFNFGTNGWSSGIT